MSRSTREEVLPRLRQRYINRGREGRSRLLDEVCEQWGFSRKHAIKLLNGQVGWGGDPEITKGRPVVYGPEVGEVVGQLWLAAEQPCGKRLKELLKLWLPYYEQKYGKLPVPTRRKLPKASAATLDRLLRSWRAKHPTRGACGTRPGSLIRSEIPIRTNNWDITRPGYLEADSVAHCGGSMSGSFIWSVTYTDIYSGWTANRAVWNKGMHEVVKRTEEVEQSLPFDLLGFDSDNGGEFLNWHLVRHFTNRKHPVGFTRSRAYHKDDNGHVEQKNWMRVRQLLGYQRLDDPCLLEVINELYRNYWDPLQNFFMPSAKLEERYREGSRLVRRHDRPQTPCDRLLNSPHMSRRRKQQLRSQRKQLNPFDLKEGIETMLKKVLLSGPGSGRPSGSLHSGPESLQEANP